MKHKWNKLHWVFIILFLMKLNLLPIARAVKEFNLNTTTISYHPFLLEHIRAETSTGFERNLVFINDSNTLNKTAIHDKFIRLENTTIFLSNTIIIGSKILATGRMDYSVLIENCIFENSEIVIDLANNVTIVHSYFILQDIGKEEPNYLIKVYNVGILFLTDTHFENESIQDNQNYPASFGMDSSTNLGMKLENVTIAELRDCTFTSIRAAESNGSAMLLKNTEVLMISCQLYLNIAKHGVIFGNKSVSITSINSSFISNHASKSGAVFYLINYCSLTNDGSVFQNNSASNYGGGIYGQDNIEIINTQTVFTGNRAENAGAISIYKGGNCTNINSSFVSNLADFDGGAINAEDNVELVNIQTGFLSNTGQFGGAIYMGDKGICINTDSNFNTNSAIGKGGGIYGQDDIDITNIDTRYIGNRAERGGSIYIRDGGNCTNNNSSFVSNDADLHGGAICLFIDVQIINNGTSFLSNTAKNGGAIYVENQGSCTNTDCNFKDNSAIHTGGVIHGNGDIDITNIKTSYIGSRAEFGGSIYIEHGGNCTNNNSTFISNKANSEGGAIYVFIDGQLINNGTRFLSNTAKFGGAIYMENKSICINTNCSFLNNSVSQSAGAIYLQLDVKLINIDTRFFDNTGEWGGAIYVRDRGICINTDSKFQNNSAFKEGGAIHGIADIEITNTRTAYTRNKAEHGGVLFMEDHVTCINTDCSFLHNSVSLDGGVIYAENNVKVINNGTKYINNRAGANGGCIRSFGGGKYINIGSVFIKNQAGGSGGVMGFWYGIDCTNINCNFTQNAAFDAGGVMYIEGSNNNVNFLSSTECILKGNSARGGGAVFDMYKISIFSSTNNAYVRNSDPTSTLSVDYANVEMADDIFGSNIGGVMISTDMKNVNISNTKFTNNYSPESIVSVNSVKSFSCFRCIFEQNEAGIHGLNIDYADQVIFDTLKVQNNNVTTGSMIMIKKSISTTVLSSFFQDNYCSDQPCALTVRKSEIVKIMYFALDSDKPVMDMIYQLINKQEALGIDAKKIALENMLFQGVSGYVYKGVTVENLFFRNVSYECPEYFIHKTEVTNTNPRTVRLSPYNLENETTIALQCVQCPENYYRFAIPSLTLMEISDLFDQNAEGTCYKCPSGGRCNGHSVVAYPNYWGFVYNSRLKFVFCSEGFCCQLGNCTTYNGCNEGREGDLCTSCKNDFQLSIVGNSCVQKEQCANSWLYGIMAISGLVYVGFLAVKNEILNIIQQIYSTATNCRRKIKVHRNSKRTSKLVRNIIPQGIELVSQDLTETDVQANMSVQKGKYWLPKEDNINNEWRVPFDHIEIFNVLVFHLQDASLFQVRFPAMQTSAVQLEEFREKLTSIVKLNSLMFWNQFTCLPPGWTQLKKILFESSIILVMVSILILCFMVIKAFRVRPNIKGRLMSSACRVFILTFLFSSQRLSAYALNFITCEDLGPARYLFIDTTIECYQSWQKLVFIYIGLFILPFWLVLLAGPGLLEHGEISVRSFLLGLMFPGPFVIYYIWLNFKAKRKPLIQLCHQQTRTAVLNEVWSSFSPFPTLNYLCWGGIVELRRLTLVFCATLITTHTYRLICMIIVLILALVFHVRFHPYYDRLTNTCANISLCAMIMVGIVNVWSASIGNSGGNFDYSTEIGKVLITIENTLVDIYPVGFVVFCIGYFLYVNLSNKQT